MAKKSTVGMKPKLALKKIVVIGPESTGKSTLCGYLADYYNTLWCPEFARQYLLENGTAYTIDDLITIARGQLDAAQKHIAALQSQIDQTGIVKPLIIDTDMYVMKVWSEYVFGNCPTFILDEINKQDFDLYLLCKPDIPWVKDELREYPDEKPRQELFQIYKDILINQQTPWVEISGSFESRNQKAVTAIDALLAH
jgi:NadR type nicotinamide-nucleotide adenylyltransferase